MSEQAGNEQESVFSRLRRQRDELRLQMHLAGKEAQDEWDKLEAKWREIEDRVEPLSGAVKEAADAAGDQAKRVTGAAMDVAERELKAGYERLRKLFD